MKRQPIIFLLLFFIASNSFAQTERDSSGLRISLLTCQPGSELYSVFGHSALRIVDSTAGTDIVYNYGTFDFNDPDFYTKFVRGKLLYFVSQVSYPDFLFEYQYFKRGVFEQVLQLKQQEKEKIQSDLFSNVREENRYYKYDFLFDNCTTRLRDIIFKTRTSEAFEPNPITGGRPTFRDHLHTYLDRAEMQWTALGIDLLLGIDADREMSISASMFLPEFLQKGVKSTNTQEGKLEKEELVLNRDSQPAPAKNPFYATPVFAITLLSLILLLPGIYVSKWGGFQLLSDSILFIVTGLLGVFLLFMWFGTDHQSFSKNVNLIWAFPFNLYFAFQLKKIKQWVKPVFKTFSVLIILLIAISLVQYGMINISLYPIMFLLSYRYWVLSKKQ